MVFCFLKLILTFNKYFQIKDHKLTVIATGGSSVEPIIVDSLVSLPGERIDFVLHAENDPDIRMN